MRLNLSIKILLLFALLAANRQQLFAQVNQWTWEDGSNATNNFTSLGALDATPGSRSDAATWSDSLGNFWVYGGSGFDYAGGGGLLNDLWKFDAAKNIWVWINGSVRCNASGV